MRELFSVLHQLASVKRYSRDHMAERESVLEHMGFCGFFAFVIAEKIKRETHIKIDMGKLLARVIAHDLDEAALGDISRTTKYYNPTITHAFKVAEHDMVVELCEKLGSPALMDAWAHAKADDIEGYIVRICDIAAVVYKVWSEVLLLNNYSFCRVARELQGFLTKISLELSGKLPASVQDCLADSFAMLHSLTLEACHKDRGWGLAL